MGTIAVAATEAASSTGSPHPSSATPSGSQGGVMGFLESLPSKLLKSSPQSH